MFDDYKDSIKGTIEVGQLYIKIGGK